MPFVGEDEQGVRHLPRGQRMCQRLRLRQRTTGSRCPCTGRNPVSAGAVAGRGTGLIGLTDRVEALGGTLTVSSPPGEGTCLTAKLPLHQT